MQRITCMVWEIVSLSLRISARFWNKINVGSQEINMINKVKITIVKKIKITIINKVKTNNINKIKRSTTSRSPPLCRARF